MKCEFHVHKVAFLGYITGPKGVLMNLFPGFTNFYQQFIQGFSIIPTKCPTERRTVAMEPISRLSLHKTQRTFHFSTYTKTPRALQTIHRGGRCFQKKSLRPFSHRRLEKRPSSSTISPTISLGYSRTGIQSHVLVLLHPRVTREPNSHLEFDEYL